MEIVCPMSHFFSVSMLCHVNVGTSSEMQGLHPEVHDALESLSQSHAAQKKHLPMGCQQQFFHRIRCRIQGRDPNALQGDRDIDDIYGSTTTTNNSNTNRGGVKRMDGSYSYSWNSEDEDNLNALAHDLLIGAECAHSDADKDEDADEEEEKEEGPHPCPKGHPPSLSIPMGSPERTHRRKSRRQNQNDILWRQRFDELQVYLEEHGDCLVPHHHPNNPDLAKFVDRQCRAHRHWREGRAYAMMTEERVQMLSDVGFVFELAAAFEFGGGGFE